MVVAAYSFGETAAEPDEPGMPAYIAAVADGIAVAEMR